MYDRYQRPSISKVEYAEQQVLEVLVPWNHAGKVLEVSSELLQLHHIIRLDVVPAPNKLVECLLLRLLVSYHFRVSLSVEYLANLF